MSVKKIVLIILSLLTVLLMVYLVMSQDSGYISPEEVEKQIQDTQTQQQTQTVNVDERTPEEIQLEELKKSLGDLSFQKTSKLFASRCSSCHGKNAEGRASTGGLNMPTLKGKDEAFILKRLHEFKHDKALNPLMSGFIDTLSEDEMQALAKEISEFK